MTLDDLRQRIVEFRRERQQHEMPELMLMHPVTLHTLMCDPALGLRAGDSVIQAAQTIFGVRVLQDSTVPEGRVRFMCVDRPRGDNHVRTFPPLMIDPPMNMQGTVTGRIRSTEANTSNIPKKDRSKAMLVREDGVVEYQDKQGVWRPTRSANVKKTTRRRRSIDLD